MPSAVRRLAGEELAARNEAKRLLRVMNISTVHDRWRRAEREALRAAYAEKYRLLFGVEPDKHDEFRAALERVAGGGGQPVADLEGILNGSFNR